MKAELYGQPVVTDLKDIMGVEILFRISGQASADRISPLDYLKAMPNKCMHWYLDATVIGILISSNTDLIKGPLFINVSNGTLTSPGVFKAWLAGVRELSFRRGQGLLVVEIPEQCDAEFELLKERLQDISDAGAALALDDYPGGKLTEEHLNLYEWDYIKICAAECTEKQISVIEAIKSARSRCPNSVIIIEQLPSEFTSQATEAGANGFQSFENGRPMQLNMRPFHSAAPPQPQNTDQLKLASNDHLGRFLFNRRSIKSLT